MEEKNNEIKIEQGIDNPQNFLEIQRRFGIKYMTSIPTYTPKQRTDVVVYFDGSNYWLYVYANGNWRNQQLGISNTTSPAGIIYQYGGSSAPSGYLLCDGSSVSRTTYSSLFAIISTIYGVGDGSTTFNVPNLKGKIPVGFNSSETEFDTLGETGGEKTHTLITSEIAAHTHNTEAMRGNGGSFAKDYFQQVSNTSSGTTTPTDSAGGGGAHNNLQPYITLNYIIKT